MSVSSKSLFHFTNEMANLVNILKDGFFWPIYCPEVDKEKKNNIHAYAFPMVCFCDIPLSQISEHTKDYGFYAIAMSKEWAKSKGVSPVIYYSGKDSLLIRLYTRNEKLISSKDKALWFALLKKYRGKTWSCKEQDYIMKVLYNEREWRYIPQNIPYKDLYMQVKYNEFSGKAVSDNTRQYVLSFSYDNIRYIILKEEKEREVFLEKLNDIISDDMIKKLICSKILTSEQIKEDF